MVLLVQLHHSLKALSCAYAISIPVIGNGLGIGLYNGTSQTVLMQHPGSAQGAYTVLGQGSAHGTSVGSYGGTLAGNTSVITCAVGLTTNPSKSGIVAYTENIILPSIQLGQFLIHY